MRNGVVLTEFTNLALFLRRHHTTINILNKNVPLLCKCIVETSFSYLRVILSLQTFIKRRSTWNQGSNKWVSLSFYQGSRIIVVNLKSHLLLREFLGHFSNISGISVLMSESEVSKQPMVLCSRHVRLGISYSGTLSSFGWLLVTEILGLLLMVENSI